jgi:ATP-dependent helicase HrpB
VEHRTTLVWDRSRDELVQRDEERLGGLVLAERSQRPEPGPAVVDALLDRVRQDRLRTLPWNESTASLRARVTFLHRTVGEPWPDWGDAALLGSLAEWLAPSLHGMTRWADVQSLDLRTVLRSALDPSVGYRLDELAPPTLDLGGGRSVHVDYTDDGPRISVRPQRLYGTTVHPMVAGIPVIIEMLSPADRPIQVTRDLPGFWSGSWGEVRKEMAGRYPKHFWPTDPGAASPR